MQCLVSHFYPSEGLEVEWELRGGPEGSFQKAEGQKWLSALLHHSDGTVSLSAHLKPVPITAEHHGSRYACRVHHPTLPALGRSAEVTLEVAGKSQEEDGVTGAGRGGQGKGDRGGGGRPEKILRGSLFSLPPARSVWAHPGGWCGPLPVCLSPPRAHQSTGLGW